MSNIFKIFIFSFLTFYVKSESDIDESVLFQFDGRCHSKHIRFDVKQLKLLENCVIIDGHLVIADIVKFETVQFALFSFPQLTQVTEYIIVNNVRGLDSLTRLFPNLTSINGKKTFRGSSLILQDIPDMDRGELEDFSKMCNDSAPHSKNPNIYVGIHCKSNDDQSTCNCNDPFKIDGSCRTACQSLMTNDEENLVRA